MPGSMPAVCMSLLPGPARLSAIACFAICVYMSVVSVVSGLDFTRGRDQEPADPGRKIDLTLRPCSAPGKQGPEQMAAVVASRISYIRRRREGGCPNRDGPRASNEEGFESNVRAKQRKAKRQKKAKAGTDLA